MSVLYVLVTDEQVPFQISEVGCLLSMGKRGVLFGGI